MSIEQQRNRWVNAINQGDAEGFVSVLTEDVVWLPFRSDAMAGRDAVHEYLKAPFDSYKYGYTIQNTRLRMAGDWVVEQSDFTTRARSRDGAEMPVHEGSYTILWRLVGEEWLIEWYVDHTDS